jgi:hypothetical protein
MRIINILIGELVDWWIGVNIRQNHCEVLLASCLLFCFCFLIMYTQLGNKIEILSV